MSPQLLRKLLKFRDGMALCIPRSDYDPFGPHVIRHSHAVTRNYLGFFLVMQRWEKEDW